MQQLRNMLGQRYRNFSDNTSLRPKASSEQGLRMTRWKTVNKDMQACLSYEIMRSFWRKRVRVRAPLSAEAMIAVSLTISHCSAYDPALPLSTTLC